MSGLSPAIEVAATYAVAALIEIWLTFGFAGAGW